MKKYIKLLACIFSFLIIISLKSTSSGAKSKVGDTSDKKTVRVVYYDFYPNYFINDKLEYDGYYHEVMKLIAKELKLEFDYERLNVYEAFNKLSNNEVDLIFGVSRTEEREEKYIYSKYQINVENMAIYTDEKVKFGDIEALEGKKIGIVKNQSGTREILKRLLGKNINFEVIGMGSINEMIEELKREKLDAIIHVANNEKLSHYSEVYRFSLGPVYLVTTKANSELMNDINQLFESGALDYSLIQLHNKYFDIYEVTERNIIILFTSIIGLIICGLAYLMYRKYLKIKGNNILKNKIDAYLRNNKYFLVYQPIVDPKKNKIKGFEALLRLNKNEEIITPNIFLNDIEKAKKMNDVSLWILKKVLQDYFIIKDFKCINDDHFYISINLSYNEIENDEFIKSIMDIIVSSKLPQNSICLEIVENIEINNLSKVQEVINNLKSVGFMVAIDDFGVEYSNLDILEKVNCNIIKLDKYFIEEIESSKIRIEVVKFVSGICKITDKIVVCEGVERQYQNDIIKGIDNEKIYIQGFYYSKPLTLEQLRSYYLN